MAHRLGILIVLQFCGLSLAETYIRVGVVIPQTLQNTRLGPMASRKECVTICENSNTCRVVSAQQNSDGTYTCGISTTATSVDDLETTKNPSDITAFSRNDGYEMYGDRFYRVYDEELGYYYSVTWCRVMEARLPVLETKERKQGLQDYAVAHDVQPYIWVGYEGKSDGTGSGKWILEEDVFEEMPLDPPVETNSEANSDSFMWHHLAILPDQVSYSYKNDKDYTNELKVICQKDK